ncbi:MAG: hypothetical protein QOE14_913 [Humisphaera sp.]|nr:hypothetical protein [Humisphaera sp.]
MASPGNRERSSFTWLYGAALALVAAPTFLVGLYLAATNKGWAMLAAGCASLVALAIAYPLLQTMQASRDASIGCINDLAGPFNERMQQMSVLLNQISEQQLISDRTKQVAYRTRDRETLRRGIHEEIANKDWEAALALANDMESIFGYKQEAARFRKDIEQKHQEVLRREINEGVAGLERFIRAERWQEALADAHKLAQSFPSDEQAHNLPQWVEERRASHKRQLIESWQDAINRRDIDGSIEILRKLDPYLTPAEAEAMQDPARNLFKEKLHSLRTQITLAVQDHNWPEAIRLGETITRDFPNTRAAQEVRDMMPALRERHAAGEGAPQTTPA